MDWWDNELLKVRQTIVHAAFILLLCEPTADTKHKQMWIMTCRAQLLLDFMIFSIKSSYNNCLWTAVKIDLDVATIAVLCVS